MSARTAGNRVALNKRATRSHAHDPLLGRGHSYFFSFPTMNNPTKLKAPSWQRQPIPYKDPRSKHMYEVDPTPLRVSKKARASYGLHCVLTCLIKLEKLARHHRGLWDLQVFSDDYREDLWFVHGKPGDPIRVITASEI